MVPLPLSCDSRPIACIHPSSLSFFCPHLTGSISCSCHSSPTTLIFCLPPVRVTVQETALTSVFFTFLVPLAQIFVYSLTFPLGPSYILLLLLLFFILFCFDLIFWNKNLISMKTHSWCTNKKELFHLSRPFYFACEVECAILPIYNIEIRNRLIAYISSYLKAVADNIYLNGVNGEGKNVRQMMYKFLSGRTWEFKGYFESKAALYCCI